MLLKSYGAAFDNVISSRFIYVHTVMWYNHLEFKVKIYSTKKQFFVLIDATLTHWNRGKYVTHSYGFINNMLDTFESNPAALGTG